MSGYFSVLLARDIHNLLIPEMKRRGHMVARLMEAV